MKSDGPLHAVYQRTKLERIEAEFLRSDSTSWPFELRRRFPAALDAAGAAGDHAGMRPTIIRTVRRCCDG
jgi:hypothetical protein